MSEDLKKILEKIEVCKNKYNDTKKRLEDITKVYREELSKLQSELDGYYLEIYKRELIKVSVEDLIKELKMILKVVNPKVKLTLAGFYVSCLKENENKKEAFEKIKLGYQKDQYVDMKISIHDSYATKLLFDSIFHFNMNVNTILSDGSKLIDHFSEDDVEIPENTIFGKKSGIITIDEDVLLKANLNINYEDLMDNSEYDEEYCYPSVKILREAILNVISKKNQNNVKR